MGKFPHYNRENLSFSYLPLAPLKIDPFYKERKKKKRTRKRNNNNREDHCSSSSSVQFSSVRFYCMLSNHTLQAFCRVLLSSI